MAEVTVKELAQVVGTPVERLLQQMQEAGLKQTSPEQPVSDDEKQALLAYLKSAHGDSAGEPRKITLKRKTMSTLKVAGSKTVNVEVRKKRTYVKRDPADAEAERQKELEEMRLAEEARVAAEAEARRQAEEAARLTVAGWRSGWPCSWPPLDGWCCARSRGCCTMRAATRWCCSAS